MNETATLTKRESEITELFAWGATKKDIAKRLYISERTVENHARNIYDKTGCSKVNELAAWWFCTTFHISFDLSPLKCKIIATFLFALTIIQAFNTDFQGVRASRTSVTRVMRTRSKDTDTINI